MAVWVCVGGSLFEVKVRQAIPNGTDQAVPVICERKVALAIDSSVQVGELGETCHVMQCCTRLQFTLPCRQTST